MLFLGMSSQNQSSMGIRTTQWTFWLKKMIEIGLGLKLDSVWWKGYVLSPTSFKHCLASIAWLIAMNFGPEDPPLFVSINFRGRGWGVELYLQIDHEQCWKVVDCSLPCFKMSNPISHSAEICCKLSFWILQFFYFSFSVVYFPQISL